MFFLRNIWVVPALPFVSFWLIILLGKRLPKKGSEVGLAAIGGSFAFAVAALIQWIARKPVGEGEEHFRHAVERDLFTWFSNGQVNVHFGTHVDGVAVTMLFVVSFISLLVHVYSLEYLHGDRRFTHYYAALSLFTCGMFVLVTASSTLQMILGWELMGLCSFMLIGHWWEEQANSNAALKAFFTTRTGDVGLLVGVCTLFFAVAPGNNGQPTFNIATINRVALEGGMTHWALLLGAIALFVAVVGKSAQFPLHTWLPDAMAGPTPVSALIHAATMVVAGVYLVARLYGVFWKAFSIGPEFAHSGLNPIAVIGGITIIIAAALAFVQSDIKKVLAYSTVSQLGYMVMALGVGAWTGGLFHLFTHAFFKACLFLGAGSVSHSGSHHSFDMKKDMGGLKRHMPITFWTFLVASLALAGIFPLAGFWSKDEILLTAGKNGYQAFMIVGLLGAAMTAAYMARCVYLTFFGAPRGAAADHHPHESPPLITVPLILLAGLSVVSGFGVGGFGSHLFADITKNEVFVQARIPEYPFSVPAAAVSLAVAIAGIALGVLWYFRNLGPHGITERSKPLHAGYSFLENKYYLDTIYTTGVVGGLTGPVARGAYWFNQNVLDGIVNGVAMVVRRIGTFTYDIIDQRIVDAAVNGAGHGAEGSGGALRLFQTGQVQQYAAVLFGAAGVFALALVIFTR